MKILFITTSHNGLSQRAYVELTELGHHIQIHVTSSEKAMEQAVEEYKPELIIAPFLKQAVPEKIWRKTTVLIVHPGIKGDRGPSALDWAIMDNWEEWGVTILQASEEMDAGDIWSSKPFSMRNVTKSHLYRHEVTQAAIEGLLDAVQKFETKVFVPESLDYNNPTVKGKLHIPVKTKDRIVNWDDTTENILRKIRAADSSPGALDELFGKKYRLFGAHQESVLTGKPGAILAKRNEAICRATLDGAIWITHMKGDPDGIKLPATIVLKDSLHSTPEILLSPFDSASQGRTFKDIWYEEREEVGFLNFDFYNGAMGTDQCKRLQQALSTVKRRSTKVIVLMGGEDIWSNGIHLNLIENAADPRQESWENIVAMNDLVREIINTPGHHVISAMQGNAGAGGAILALAADEVLARNGIILNPHYKKMGGLYGSEYWTYLLPKRVGKGKAIQLTEECKPLGTSTAKRIGLIDDSFGDDVVTFKKFVQTKAEKIAKSSDWNAMMKLKNQKRAQDEAVKPLESYRSEELEKMKVNFFGVDPAYHIARFRFVRKIACSVQLSPEVVRRFFTSSSAA